MSAGTQIDFSKYETPAAPQIDFSKYEKPIETAAPEQPNMGEKVLGAIKSVYSGLPPGMASDLTKHIGDWASGRAEQNRQENLAAAAKGQLLPHSETTNTALGMLGSTGKMASGATSMQGLATAGAAAVAPEIVGPAMLAHGGYSAVKNAPAALKGNPDAVEAALGGLSEAASGGAVAGQAVAGGLGNTLTAKAGKVAAQGTGLASPEAVPSMMRAIKPTNSKTDFPQTLASAGPDLQAHAQATGQPIKTIADLVEAVPGAKKSVWQEYQQKLGPNAKATIDGNSVADAMVNSIDKRTRIQNPQLVKQIESTADTYRKPISLQDAEDFLQSANNDLHSYYAKNKVGQQVAANDPTTGHVVAEAQSLRSALNGKLDELTGPGTADIKRRYGALSELQEQALRRKNVADRQSQVGTMASLGKIAGVAKVVKGVVKLDPGDIMSGLSEGALGQRISNLNNTDWLINNAFNGPNGFAPRGKTLTVGPLGVSVPSTPKQIPGGGSPLGVSASPATPENIVSNAGAKYVGVQKGYGVRPDMVLFQPKSGGTTLSIDIDKLTPESISSKIKKIPTNFRQNLSESESMDDPDTRFNTARHETGHAVISELLRPGSVTGMGLDAQGGFTNATPPLGKTNTNQLNPEEIRNLIAVSYAGGMSEPGGTTAKHVGPDQARRADILSGSATTPLSNLARIVTGHTFGQDQFLAANQQQAEAHARVNAMLADPNTRNMIESLAQMLNVNGKMSGSEIRAAMAKGGRR